jgi:hypothetical protein
MTRLPIMRLAAIATAFAASSVQLNADCAPFAVNTGTLSTGCGQVSISGAPMAGTIPAKALYIDNSDNTGYSIMRLNAGGQEQGVGGEVRTTGSNVSLGGGAYTPLTTVLASWDVNGGGVAIAAARSATNIRFFAGGYDDASERMRVSPTNVQLKAPLLVSSTASFVNTANFQVPFTVLGGPATNGVYGSGVDGSLDLSPSGRSPYVFQWHSGLNFAAHSVYGGIRFFNQSYPAPYNAQMVMALTDGRVGIGTTTPATPLDVNGATTLRSTLSVAGAATLSSGANISGGATVTGNASFLGGVNFANAPFTILGGPQSNGVFGSGIDSALDVSPAGRSPYVFQWHTGLNFAAHSAYGGIRFFNQSYPAPYNAQLVMSLTNGRVGIGTSNPAYLLDVAGDAHFSGTVTGGNIQATYQDVAEWVPATNSMPAGTVVVVEADARNTVAPSAHAYDTRVAGVISAQPGVILGVEGPSKAKVATTGRVNVRVDATRAPIRSGDLLVTSDRPGFAMRSEPVDLGGVKIHRPGTLIGKALEPLESGEGEILVLLSLQ